MRPVFFKPNKHKKTPSLWPVPNVSRIIVLNIHEFRWMKHTQKTPFNIHTRLADERIRVIYSTSWTCDVWLVVDVRNWGQKKTYTPKYAYWDFYGCLIGKCCALMRKWIPSRNLICHILLVCYFFAPCRRKYCYQYFKAGDHSMGRYGGKGVFCSIMSVKIPNSISIFLLEICSNIMYHQVSNEVVNI